MQDDKFNDAHSRYRSLSKRHLVDARQLCAALLCVTLLTVYAWILTEIDCLTGPAALDAMARARVATMRLRKQRQTELLALAGCHSRAETLTDSVTEAPTAETLRVR